MSLVSPDAARTALAVHRMKYPHTGDDQFTDAYIAGINALADVVRPELIQLREQVALLRKGGSLTPMSTDDSGYELDDPKHPTYRERMLEQADILREQLKENPPTPAVQPDDGPSETKEQE